MNTLNTLNTRNTRAFTTVTRREISHRFASLGLAVVMTLSILGSIDLLAVGPAADSLLAQRSPIVVSAPASSPNV